MSRPEGGRGILLDLVATQSTTSQHRGIARWITGLGTALAQRPDRLRRLLLDPSVPRPANLPEVIDTSPRLTWNTASEFGAALAEGPAVYCVGSPFEFGIPAASLLPAHVMETADVALATVLYDVIPLIREGTYLDDPGMSRRYRQRLDLLRRADLVLAISECTRRDGIAHVGLDPERVVAVGTGVDPFFTPAAGADDPLVNVREALPGVDRPFVLTVSAADERKNTETLIAAYAALGPTTRRHHRLVVACRLVEGLEARLRATAARVGLDESEMVLTGLVDDALLRDLYRACAVFAFPSRYEGFGLPVAEAMACGAPVLTSNASSLPEVLDWPEATFDPDDAAGLAGLLQRALGDTGFGDRLRSLGLARAPVHSWPVVADRTVAAIDSVLEARAPAMRTSVTVRRRLRVALLGPVPPIPSGVATYNERVAAELVRRCHLDVLAPAGVDHRIPGAGRFPMDALGTVLNPAAYDAIVYTLGNNEDHVATVGALRRWPGVLWMHDVRLPFLARALQSQPGPPGEPPWAWVEPVLAARERRPPRPKPIPEPWRGPDSPADLPAALAARSRAVLVNAPYAADLLRDDAGPAAATLPAIEVLGGLAVPAVRRLGRVPRDSPPIVVSMGIVDPVKRPELLVDAHAEVHAVTGARLALVGLVGTEHAAALAQRAARLGIGDAVTVTGHVEAGEYLRWLARASVAVQLRRRSNGESSAAIADCLGAGLPVVTDHPGALEELGPDAAVHIQPGASAAQLAAAILRLLRDEVARAAQSEAALTYAADHPFSRVAEELLAVVERLPPLGSLAEAGR